MRTVKATMRTNSKISTPRCAEKNLKILSCF